MVGIKKEVTRAKTAKELDEMLKSLKKVSGMEGEYANVLKNVNAIQGLDFSKLDFKTGTTIKYTGEVFKKLGLDSACVDWVTSEFEHALEPQYTKYLPTDEDRVALMFPEKPENMERIMKFNPGFGLAYLYFVEVLRVMRTGVTNASVGAAKVKAPKVEFGKHTKDVPEGDEKALLASIKKIEGPDRLELNRLRKVNVVDPTTLDPKTPEGLANVVDVFKNKLNLNPKDVDFMAAQLSYAFDSKVWESKSAEERLLFQFPEGNLSKIAAIDNGFYLAYSYFLSVKKTITEQGSGEKTRIGAQREKTQDPIFRTVYDNLHEAGSKFMTAVEEQDWSTVAVYSVGAYAFYKLWGKTIKPMLSGGGEHGVDVGKWLMYGTAAYCGLAIFKPDYLKKMWGKGVSTDIKGTAWENMARTMKLDPEAYKKGIEVGTLAAVSEARVKDIYAPIMQGNPNFDAKSARFNMIQLNSPGVSKYFDPDIVKVGPIYLDQRPFPSLNPQEKAYVKACEQLFASAMWMKTLWEKNLYTKNGVSFEKKFLGEDSQEYTMEEVADQLSAYTENKREVLWTSKIMAEARKDLLPGNGGTPVFENIDAAWLKEESVGTHRLSGRVMGFPIVIKLNENPTTGEKEYRFYLANDADEGSDPVATAVAGNADSGKTARGHVLDAVKGRMAELVKGVSAGGKEGIKAIDFDGHKWTAEFTAKAVPKYEITERTVKIDMEVYDSGKEVKCTSFGSTAVIMLDEKMAERADYSPLIITNIMNQANGAFNALNIFYEDNKVKFEDIPGDATHFYLIVTADKEYKLKCKYAKGKDFGPNKYSVDDPEVEKEMVKSPAFRSKYVEVFDRQHLKFFDEMKRWVDDMPETFFLYLPEGLASWGKDATADDWFRGVSLDAFSGSIKDYYTQMLIDGKRESVKSQLFWAIGDATSLKDIEDKKKRVSDFASSLQGYYNNILKKAEPKAGRAKFDRDTFMAQVIDPLKRAGLKSGEYAFALNRFEGAIFQKLGLKGNDFFKNSHLISGKLFAVYSYYTAHLDSADLDKGSTADERKNSNLYANYFQYVQDGIIDKGREFLRDGKSPENIPSPSVFGLKTFEEWKATEAKVAALNPIDEKDPFHTYDTEIVNDNGALRTPLEAELVKAYRGIVEDLKKEYPTQLSKTADRYLASVLGYKNTDDATGPLKPKEERTVFVESRTIIVAFPSRRSLQMAQVQEYERRFLMTIMENKRFWENYSLVEKGKIAWRKLF